LIYVDDIIIIGTSISIVQQISSSLNSTFSLKQLGRLNYFLGIKIQYQPNNSLVMTQSKYIHDLLHKTRMTKAQFVSSPMVSS